jgi:hypothetical protein
MWGPEEISAPQNCSNIAPHCPQPTKILRQVIWGHWCHVPDVGCLGNASIRAGLKKIRSKHWIQDVFWLGAKHISNPDFGAILIKESDSILCDLLTSSSEWQRTRAVLERRLRLHQTPRCVRCTVSTAIATPIRVPYLV